MNNTCKNKSYKNKSCKNKTCKNKTRYEKRKNFVKNLLCEWKKQTDGNVKMDTTTQYVHDYYLSLTKINDKENHVHLALRHYNEKENIYKKYIRFGYIFKKYNNQHSSFKLISINDDPKKIIKIMIYEFKKYLRKK